MVDTRTRILVGVVIVIAAVAVLSIGETLYRDSAESRPEAVARRAAEAKARRDQTAASLKNVAQAKRLLLDNGTLTRIDCQSHEIQADGAAWSMTTLETKRRTVDTLSGICFTETGYKRITVLDNRTGRKLAEFSGYSATEFY